jgi:hypothetical protein
MESKEAIKARIECYKKRIATSISPFDNPILTGLINELEWCLNGIDAHTEEKRLKARMRVADGRWFKKRLGSAFLAGKEIHHSGIVTPTSEAGMHKVSDIGKLYCYILEEEAHKRLHGKKTL